jgi:hypothetical protein
VKLPPLHYDYMRKNIPWLLSMAHATFHDVPTEDLIAGDSSFVAHGFGPLAAQSMFAMVMFERCQQKVFALGPKIADALCRTALSGVMADMLEVPASTFYVALPDCKWSIWGGERTQWHQLGGFYVQKVDRTLRRPDGTISNRRQGLHLLLWGMPNEHSRNMLDDAAYWFSVPIDGGEDLEEQFGSSEFRTTDRPFGYVEDDLDQGERLDTDDKDVHRRHLQSTKNCFHLAVNMMLYLASEDPDVATPENVLRKIQDQLKRTKSPGKRKKLERRLDNIPHTVITYVGPKLEEEAKERARSEAEQGERLAPRAHLVRPHWRHYWLGKKGSQHRVRKWVHMFERGLGEVERTITKFREPGQTRDITESKV